MGRHTDLITVVSRHNTKRCQVKLLLKCWLIEPVVSLFLIRRLFYMSWSGLTLFAEFRKKTKIYYKSGLVSHFSEDQEKCYPSLRSRSYCLTMWPSHPYHGRMTCGHLVRAKNQGHSAKSAAVSHCCGASGTFLVEVGKIIPHSLEATNTVPVLWLPQS